jgi:glutathione peroxidase-family protein
MLKIQNSFLSYFMILNSILVIATTSVLGAGMDSTNKTSSIYDFSLKDEKGGVINFKDFQGKVILLTNIATKCGFTPQLKEFQELHDKFSSRGLIIVGIPSNDFGEQTPEGKDKKVTEFCNSSYKVKFLITEMVKVKGKDKHPIFDYIAVKRGGIFNIMWNFEKFLFDVNGNLVDSYRSITKPLDGGLVRKIDELLPLPVKK